jgi:putative transposase
VVDSVLVFPPVAARWHLNRRSTRSCAHGHDSMLDAIPREVAAIIDSQSVKTLMGGIRGYDGHKKVAGCKCHLLVDTEGLLLAVAGHPANIPDRAGGQRVLKAAGNAYPRLQPVWADQGSTGTLRRWAEQEHGWSVQVVYPTWRQLQRYAPALCRTQTTPNASTCRRAAPVVERTFSWIDRQRRLSKDYERIASTEEAFVYLVGIRLLLARLAPAWKERLFKHVITSSLALDSRVPTVLCNAPLVLSVATSIL